MELKSLYETLSSFVVSLTFFQKENDDLKIKGSGSGFLTEDGYLITNFHVMENVLLSVDKSENCFLRLGYCSGIDENVPIFSSYDFSGKEIKNLITGYDSSEQKNDYIILKLDLTLLNLAKKIKKLEFLIDNTVYIGQKVCILGYPFGKKNLSINRGIVSSIYKKCGVKIFQIDGIINNGNSGGPLVDLETGKVIGIITRKEDGLNELFKQLKEQIKMNSESLRNAVNAGVTISIGNIDFAKALFVSFDNSVNLVKQIERSTNVGIGYAFSLNKVIESLNTLRENSDSINRL